MDSKSEILGALVDRGLPALSERSSPIASVERERAAFASSYASDVLTVRLQSGEKVKIFVKNFGVTTFAKDEAERRRERERGVYEDLLADAELGTARCYGAVWDESRGRFWLLLEHIEGSEVRFCRLDSWLTAAGWLARGQAHFARQSDRLSKCEFLARHDADFFRSKAELALRDLIEISTPLARQLEKLLVHFDEVVEVMASQPRTLVHGHYRPCNIIAAITDQPARLCPVDWERAAFGSVFYDLALLTDGFGPTELDRFIDAYRAEALAHHVDAPDTGTTRHVVSCFQLFLGILLLSRARERGFSEQKVAKTMARLERLNDVISTRRTAA